MRERELRKRTTEEKLQAAVLEADLADVVAGIFVDVSRDFQKCFAYLREVESGAAYSVEGRAFSILECAVSEVLPLPWQSTSTASLRLFQFLSILHLRIQTNQVILDENDF